MLLKTVRDRKCESRPASALSSVTGLCARPGRILLVDDHPIVCQGLRSVLAGHQNLAVVGQAADGVEALAKARELSPDLVLMDIDLPKLSGLVVTEILRREQPQLKVIILSMHSPDL